MAENNTNEVQFLVNALADVARVGRQRALYAGQFNGNTKRTKLWDEFGYPDAVNFEILYRTYRRNSAAYAGVHKTLDSCWVDKPVIIEGPFADKSKKETEWEKLVTKLLKKHWAKIKDADRRNMVGHYSAIILQIKDNRPWSEPVDAALVKALGESALVKLIPAWESQIKPNNYDVDTMSPTYGQPVDYTFNEQPVGDDGTYGNVRSVMVHPSRVIILAEGSEDDNMLSGIPLNEAGFNDLLDIEKTKGGSAEGFLKNASRQLGVEFTKDTDMESLKKAAIAAGYKDLGDALDDKITRLNRGSDSALVMQAGQASVLSVAAADPTPSWTVSANSYASTIRCPFNILFGKQTGNLASTEDNKAWAAACNERRNSWMSSVITSVVQRWSDIGIIPQPKTDEITVDWSDLLAPGDSEKLDNMGKLAEIAYKTQQAYGTPAVEANEIRAAGELEPIKETTEPDPNAPPTGKDPLNDGSSSNPNRDANNTPQQS
ncbi:anti-CBASS protein Acb1 family protein [Yersinia kristensenii]|uniref:anti-CBASS protein Acb1 family protein n=1 Tax=Yersinia kristensenii TaxID=28152 RepID=UPI0011A587ED|nr:anti-CBASS Acb1 family protein [Yersinia kristensenii]